MVGGSFLHGAAPHAQRTGECCVGKRAHTRATGKGARSEHVHRSPAGSVEFKVEGEALGLVAALDMVDVIVLGIGRKVAVGIDGLELFGSAQAEQTVRRVRVCKLPISA